jgi:hypothetical protein
LALTPWPHSQAEPSSTDPEVSQLGESGLVGGIQGQISLREAVADASYTVPWRNELGFSGVFYKISGFLEFFLLPGMSQLFSIFRWSNKQQSKTLSQLSLELAEVEKEGRTFAVLPWKKKDDKEIGSLVWRA